MKRRLKALVEYLFSDFLDVLRAIHCELVIARKERLTQRIIGAADGRMGPFKPLGRDPIMKIFGD